MAVLAACAPSTPAVVAPVGQGCLACHAGVTGLDAAHAPTRLGCEACHGGAPSAATPEAAHQGLIRIPGNVGDMDRTCGAAGCHPEMPPRLRASIMFTMAGVISVDREVFGEPEGTPAGSRASPGFPAPEGSPADTHLRGLCLSCHLGAVKDSTGPIDETSRGGACNACHLTYDDAARADLGHASTAGFVHPKLVATPTDEHCFGCHSRSGRISLQAAGWREARPGEPRERILDDGRALTKAPGDLHTAAGFLCVDCHTSVEIMGIGESAAHREDQQRVRCEDCHRVGADAAVTPGDRLEPETRRLAVRLAPVGPEAQFVQYDGDRFAFPNVFVEAGQVRVRLKSARRVVEARAPAAACGRSGPHQRVACAACHDAWAPQCVGCHTSWNPDGRHVDLVDGVERPGEWLERSGEVFSDRPTLGVREAKDGTVARFEGFVPGMILTLAPTPGGAVRFRRAFAALSAHTTSRSARSCDDCHRSPLALGFGRGHLVVVAATDGRSVNRHSAGVRSVGPRAGGGSSARARAPAPSLRWRFLPTLPRRSEDGLPADAWIPFPGIGPRPAQASGDVPAPRGMSTRPNTRPLDETELGRILRVGACLGCHAPGTPVMTAALGDFTRTDARRGPRCLVPDWP